MPASAAKDRHFMELAVSRARESRAEDARPHPFVGAVAVREGIILGEAFRGELGHGHHAEFSLLEEKLKGEILAGATVFTTLEPCTTRTHPKIPCAERLIERGVARVVIGVLDPNPQIRGLGVIRLREARIAVDFFEADLVLQLEELNRDFTRAQRQPKPIPLPTAELADQIGKRSLQDWYSSINIVYWSSNFHLDRMDIFAHLVEVIGGLSGVASRKKKPGVDASHYMAKSIAWWLALCGKVGIRDVEELLWDKFPAVCPYCLQKKCLGEDCGEVKSRVGGPNWEELARIGDGAKKARRVSEWQQMFAGIYPASPGEDPGAVFGRLTEELGELAEALRVLPAEPGYFLSEAADVFAWLMHVQNRREADQGVPRAERGKALELDMAAAYPGGCGDCGQSLCACPPILASTIGRIAHEVPAGRAGFDRQGRFDPPSVLRERFQRAIGSS